MKTSIVIATFNKMEYTQQCIHSIREFTQTGDYEIIIIDNNSTDGTLAWLKQQADIRTISNSENFGFPKACNQGIEIAQGDTILLLNNDTIVTKNWLSNLLVCLYSDDNIGAVGSVTNNISYYQTIPVDYQSIEEMQIFAANYNQSDPAQWEERLKLIGYSMLIKKSVIDSIGMLDEQFSPGNYEDDDYSLRIRIAGYKIILCKDTFIHHYGSTSFKENISEYSELLRTNQNKFMNKWGFNPDTSNIIRIEFVNLITNPREEAIRVLEIGCECGGTLLNIKSLFPNAELYGVDTNPATLEVASIFVQTVSGNLEGSFDHFEKDFFDYIIFSANLHEIDKPQETLNRLKGHLKIEGKLIANLPNLMHFEVIRNFIQGTANKTKLSYYKLNDVHNLFESSGYKNIQITALRTNKRPEYSLFIQGLTDLSGIDASLTYNVLKFLVLASRTGVLGLIVAIIDEIQAETNVNENLSKLCSFETAHVIEAVISHALNPIHLLNHLAILYFQRGIYENILPYLNKAYELDNHDSNTLYNLGCVLHSFEESEMAINYLQSIENKDDQIIQFIEEINQSMKPKKIV